MSDVNTLQKSTVLTTMYVLCIDIIFKIGDNRMKKELLHEEFIDYLKHVADTELLLYKLETIREEAEIKGELPEPVRKYVSQPKLSYADLREPSPPTPQEASYTKKQIAIMIISGILLIPSVFSKSVLGITVCTIAALSSFISHRKTVAANKALYDRYRSEYEEYQNNCESRKQKYDIAMADYNLKQNELNIKYNEECRITQAKQEIIDAEISELDAPIEQTRAILEELYALDYIYPKYRNMIAMTSIYEYYLSGRVDMLTGPNGAYNLFEQESRQNIIISNLETINTNLEAIKYNQCLIYGVMVDIRNVLYDIDVDISKMKTSLEKIVFSTNEMLADVDRILANSNEILANSAQIVHSTSIMESRMTAIELNTATRRYIECF